MYLPTSISSTASAGWRWLVFDPVCDWLWWRSIQTDGHRSLLYRLWWPRWIWLADPLCPPLVCQHDGADHDPAHLPSLPNGGFKKAPWINLITGVVLAVITVSFGVTGYSLPWDQVGYWLWKLLACARGNSHRRTTISDLLRGGSSKRHLTRYYSAHTLCCLGWLLSSCCCILNDPQARHFRSVVIQARVCGVEVILLQKPCLHELPYYNHILLTSVSN